MSLNGDMYSVNKDDIVQLSVAMAARKEKGNFLQILYY